jgi:hypothetical protein
LRTSSGRDFIIALQMFVMGVISLRHLQAD